MVSEVLVFFAVFLFIFTFSQIFTKKTQNIHQKCKNSYRAIVLNDGKSIKEAFNLPSLSGRPKIKFLDETFMNRAGIGWADGPIAKELLQFSHRKLKDSGFGSQRMEAKIQEQIPKLLETFDRSLGGRLEVKDTFGPITLGCLWGIFNGLNDDGDEKEFQKFIEHLRQLGSAPPQLALSIFLPKLLSWFPNLTGYNQRWKIIVEIHNYIQKIITMHEKTHAIDAPRDFIDQFLDQGKISPQVFTNIALKVSLMELLGAGADTSTSTLELLIFYLVKHPEIQDKLAQEIHTKIPTREEVRFSDRSNMPFFEAILNETLRISSIFPFAVFHAALEDTEIQGFLIKKGTIIVGNSYAAHNDPSLWEDPHEFKPERFLGEDGKSKDAASKLLAFGTGKRKCIGEVLARHQVFMFAVNIFRHYKLRPWGKLNPGRVSALGFILSVESFFVEVSRRQ